MIARVFAGGTEGLTRGDVLDNVTLYWLTNTAISSARLYWDTTQISTGGAFFDVRGVKIPVAVSAFPDEIYQAPRSWAERAYPKLIHYNKLDKGGHFAAWDSPPSSGQRSGRCANRRDTKGGAHNLRATASALKTSERARVRALHPLYVAGCSNRIESRSS